MIDPAMMQRPEGSMVSGSVKMNGPGIMEVVAGAHVFRVFVDEDSKELVFVHGSPGTGTRATRAPVKSIYPEMLTQELFMALTWSPESLKLYVQIKGSGGELIASGETVAHVPKLLVDRSGGVYEVGGPGVMMDARVWVDGVQELSPSAVDLWDSVREWAHTLLAAVPDEGPDFHTEVAISNAAFVSLVSGYEVYLQDRFREVDREGVPADRVALKKRLPREVERAEDAPPEHFIDALARAINFQNWSKAKDAFAAGYGVVFGNDLDLPSAEFERIQRLLKYRHRMIHAHPMVSLLNPMFPKEEAEFSGKAFVRASEDTLARFVTSLHAATLRLRPAEPGAGS